MYITTGYARVEFTTWFSIVAFELQYNYHANATYSDVDIIILNAYLKLFMCQ